MLTSREKTFLARSADFQQLLAEDSFLRSLDIDSSSRTEELHQLLALGGVPQQVGNLKIRPLTAGVWSFLWCVGSNYVCDMQKITEADTDLFLCLLCQKKLPDMKEGVAGVLAESANWCRKFGIDYSECAAFLMQCVQEAFMPFSLMPPPTGGGDPDWGCVWLTQYGCTVACESGQSVEYCMFEMPLRLGNYCMINKYRKNDPHGTIYKRTPKEKAELVGEYIEKLGRSFIDRQGGIPSP